MTMSVPGPKPGSRPPAAFVRTIDPRAEAAHEQDRLDDEPGVVALVHVEPALEHDDRHAVELAEEQPADVTRRGRGRPARQVRERDGDGVLEVVGEAAEPRAEHDPDLSARGPPARTAASSASSRAGWSAGGSAGGIDVRRAAESTVAADPGCRTAGPTAGSSG